MLVGGMQISVSGRDDKGHESSLVGVWVRKSLAETVRPAADMPRAMVEHIRKGRVLLETIGWHNSGPGNGIWKREHGWNSIPSLPFHAI
jgi:hypothetical protein